MEVFSRKLKGHLPVLYKGVCAMEGQCGVCMTSNLHVSWSNELPVWICASCILKSFSEGAGFQEVANDRNCKFCDIKSPVGLIIIPGEWGYVCKSCWTFYSKLYPIETVMEKT
jgi:hypothetical protein